LLRIVEPIMRLLALFILFQVTAAELLPQAIIPGHFIVIDPADSPGSILEKAASVCPSPRQVAWQVKEFSLFIHFGINTFTDQEWGRGVKEEGAALFNPEQLDARQWVRVAQEAGARQLIVVAKHHDGFCLWPTAWTEYSVKRSPWRDGKGDLIAEVAAACREAGLALGVYLSPWDISSPLYGSDAYNTYFKNQLRELLTGYGEIAEVWFDGACGEGPNGKRQVYDWRGYYTLIRELQPRAVIAVMGPDVRWVGTESGEGRETEWSVIPLSASTVDDSAESSGRVDDGVFVPIDDVMQADLGSREKFQGAKTLAWYPSEVDVSIRPGWFYHAAQDSQVKSPQQLVDIYYTSVGRNSHLLLNVPPDRRGLIHEGDICALRTMKAILDETFARNIASGARAASRSMGRLSALVDDDPATAWVPEGGVTDPVVEFDLGREESFNRLLLEENFRCGQRVEAFVLDVKGPGGWVEVVRGTTIGYRRLLRFPRVVAREVRLRILESRSTPQIASFGLFQASQHETGH
jgi:alpha-L-fucosidase